jgi:hypothetical protein
MWGPQYLTTLHGLLRGWPYSVVLDEHLPSYHRHSSRNGLSWCTCRAFFSSRSQRWREVLAPWVHELWAAFLGLFGPSQTLRNWRTQVCADRRHIKLRRSLCTNLPRPPRSRMSPTPQLVIYLIDWTPGRKLKRLRKLNFFFSLLARKGKSIFMWPL